MKHHTGARHFAAITALLAIALLAPACGDDDGFHHHEGHHDVIAAPSQLAALVVPGGVHLTWVDNSTREDGFMVLRRTGGSVWDAVANTAADETSFHDATVASGRTYEYVVHAMVGNDSSASSNVVAVAVP